MQVRDLQEVLGRLSPDLKLRVVMTADASNLDPGDLPYCRFSDSNLPDAQLDPFGILELRFSDE